VRFERLFSARFSWSALSGRGGMEVGDWKSVQDTTSRSCPLTPFLHYLSTPPQPHPNPTPTPTPTLQALPLIEMYLASIPPRQLDESSAAAAAEAGVGGMLEGVSSSSSSSAAAAAPAALGVGDGKDTAVDGLTAVATAASAAAAAPAPPAAASAAGGGVEQGFEADASAPQAVGAAAAAAPCIPVPPCGKDARTVTPLPFEFPEGVVTEDVAVEMVRADVGGG